MKFADLLKEYTGNKTLDEIVSYCAGKGIQVDAPYLSRLRSGNRHRLPPTDEGVVRAIAEACGRDPEPLVILAKYERNPYEIMEMIIDKFVRASVRLTWIDDMLGSERSGICAALELGHNVPTSDIVKALKGDFDYIESAREEYFRFMDEADKLVSLVSDTERTGGEGFPGEKGTLPEPKESAVEKAVYALTELTKVSPAAVWAAVAAARAVADPQSEAMNNLVEAVTKK